MDALGILMSISAIHFLIYLLYGCLARTVEQSHAEYICGMMLLNKITLNHHVHIHTPNVSEGTMVAVAD